MNRMFAHLAIAAAVAAAVGMLLPMNANAQDQDPAATQPQGEVELPVKSVTLFSSGVGFFEHAGTVDGQAATQLRFKADEIDDLLKSLVLQDLDGGQVQAVTYPSAEPLDRQLGSFQIDLGGDVSLVGLLNQLKGAKVTLQTTDVTPITGTVVSVDQRNVAEGDNVLTKDFITLFTGSGLKSTPIDKVTDFTIEDPRLQQEMARALEALAKARDKDKKAVGFSFTGEGERRVRLGYVVESPVWKTSYRLLLAESEDQDTNLQGWAIVENQTDNDWDNIQLSLVSGRPISFEMDLSQPLFVQRPILQIPRFQSLTPKAYEEGMDSQAAQVDESRRRPLTAMGSAGGGGADGFGVAQATPAAAPAMEAMDMAKSVQSVASAANLGELFQYTVGSVTLARQSSAMIPVVTDPVDAEKVSLYDPAQLAGHPLNAVILTNTTDKHLLAGPVTVYEAGGYAGDSQIADLPPGGERLLTYGIDLKLKARIEPKPTRSELVTGSLSRGVLTLKRRIRTNYLYVFDNDTDADREVVIEHVQDRGYKLIDTPEPYETTDAVRRFKLTAKPGVTEFNVASETVTDEHQQLIGNRFDADALLALSRNGPLPQAVKDALVKAAELRRAVSTAQEQLATVEKELNAISQEQGRLRQNMDAVDNTSAYYKRLLTKLDEQETRIEELQVQAEELRTKVQAAEAAYRDYLSNLNV